MITGRKQTKNRCLTNCFYSVIDTLSSTRYIQFRFHFPGSCSKLFYEMNVTSEFLGKLNLTDTGTSGGRTHFSGKGKGQGKLAKLGNNWFIFFFPPLLVVHVFSFSSFMGRWESLALKGRGGVRRIKLNCIKIPLIPFDHKFIYALMKPF